MSSASNKNYHHGDLKAALLNAAKRIITDNGIDALSLRTLANEVGVSHMAPYAHFKNKSELFKSIAAEGYLKLAEKLQIIQQNPDKSKKLILHYGVAYIEYATSNPQLYQLMLSQSHPDQSNDQKSFTENDKKLHDASKKTFVLLRDCFKHNQSTDNLFNVQAQGAWAFVHGIASLLITGQIVISKKSNIKEFVTIAIKAINQ